MMKRLLFLFTLCLSFSLAFSQGDYDDEQPPSNNEEFVGFGKKGKREKPKKDLSKLRFGPDIGFGVGSVSTGTIVSFSLRPTVGYQVIENRLELGGGFDYQLFNYKSPSQRIVENQIGPVLYARAYIVKGLFVQLSGVYSISKRKDIRTINSQKHVRKYDNDFYNVFGAVGYTIEAGVLRINPGLSINLIKYDLTKVNASAKYVLQPFINIQLAF